MIDGVLGWTPGFREVLILMVLFAMPVVLLVWFVRAISRNKKENAKLRLELDKLVDELEQISKEAQARKKD